jgi:ribose transport system permease protein
MTRTQTRNDTAVIEKPVSRGRRFADWLFVSNPMILALILLMIVSNVLYPGFFEPQNLRNLAIQNAAIALVALGMTLVMITGGFDLSVGATFALGAVVFGILADTMPLPIAGLIALLAGGACGLVNALVITKLGVNPFVATLGLGSVFSGIAYWVAKSSSIIPMNLNFDWLARTQWFGIAAGAAMVAITYVVIGVALSRTPYGRSIYAVGGNFEAARLAGLRVDLVRGSTYVIVAICAAGAGILTASRSGVAQADLGGSVPLAAIAIVVIGGTSLLGGEGSVAKTVLGLAIMATITNLFNRMAAPLYVQLIAQGLIIVAAVALDLFTKRRRR